MLTYAKYNSDSSMSGTFPLLSQEYCNVNLSKHMCEYHEERSIITPSKQVCNLKYMIPGKHN